MLTDGQASAAQAADKDYKLADANGLYLFVTKSGFKSWRMKYRFGGKEKRLTFGPYPEVSLEEARDRRDQARRLLRDQIDPALERQRLRAAGLAADEPEPDVAEGGAAAQPALAFVAADLDGRATAHPSSGMSAPLGDEGHPDAAVPVVPEPGSIPPLDDAAKARRAAARRTATAVIEGDLNPFKRPDHSPMAELPDPDPATAAPPAGEPPVPEPPVRAATAQPPATPAAAARPSGKGLIFSSLRPAHGLTDQPVRAGLKPTPDPVPAAADLREPVSPRDPVPPPTPDASPTPAPPRVPAEDEPAVAVPFTPEVATGSRALALLRQAEDAVAEARKESRAAKRIAAAVLVLFVVAALAAAGWLMRQRAAVGAPVELARRTAAVGAAAPIGTVHAPASIATAPPAMHPPAMATPHASVAPPLSASPSVPAAPGAPVAAASPSPPAVARHAAASRPSAVRHHHHRRHRRHGRRHRTHLRPSPATPAVVSRRPHAQEISHDVQVTAPRRADAIDPALDRYGRAALCLRAAYSADPGCAALRGAGRQ